MSKEATTSSHDARGPRQDYDFPLTQGAEHAAAAIARAVRDAVAARGECTMALGGGRSPADIYRSLRDAQLPWDSINVMQTDERLADVRPGHNWRSICASGLLEGRAPARLHPVDCDLPPIDACGHLSRTFELLGRIDVAVFGVGPDGHVASLVGLRQERTDHARLSEHDGTVRVTLCQEALSSARHRFVAVSGDERREALDQALRAQDDTGRATLAVLVPGPSTLCLL